MVPQAWRVQNQRHRIKCERDGCGVKDTVLDMVYFTGLCNMNRPNSQGHTLPAIDERRCPVWQVFKTELSQISAADPLILRLISLVDHVVVNVPVATGDHVAGKVPGVAVNSWTERRDFAIVSGPGMKPERVSALIDTEVPDDEAQWVPFPFEPPQILYKIRHRSGRDGI